jgi:gamma-tubulin complex component 6
VNKKNVYLPTKSQQLICLPSAATTPNDDCSFFSGILDAYTGNNKKKTNQLPPNVTMKCIEAPPIPETCTRKHKLINNWENINADDFCNKSFSSESMIPIQQHLSASQKKNPVEIKTIPFEKLLNDIKLLTIGIESESFKRSQNDPLTFEMAFNLSCTDISDVSQFVEELLDAGSCFRRLKTFTSKNPYNQSYIFEGFIFKAFGDCVIKFMNTYRDIVYSQDVKTLLEFSSNTKNIRKILIHLTKFLKIHPSSKYRSKLPTGSDFLGLLYNEYTTIFNHDVKCFFIECLKSCCQIYFNNFHKWLFHGYIEDPNKELFIYFVDHYRPNTKYFFDKAYVIRKQSVPGFLQGCAENILLCGKYTMLLKSYNQVVSFPRNKNQSNN